MCVQELLVEHGTWATTQSTPWQWTQQVELPHTSHVICMGSTGCVCVGSLVCCASDEGSVRIVETSSDKVLSLSACTSSPALPCVCVCVQEWNMEGEGRALDAVLNKQADSLFSANTLGEVIIWQ